MTVQDEGRDEQRRRLQAQVGLILSGIPGVMDGLEGAAAHPADWADRGEVDYNYRERTLLVRDADVDRVAAVVPAAPVAHDNNVRGLTRLEFSAGERRSVEEACSDIDRALGEGVATPEHILYVCAFGTCPATEPEEVPGGAEPDPPVSAEARDGEGVLIVIPDSGLLPGADAEHTWLKGVEGEMENPMGGYPPRILPYAGHGTFAAGIARTMAPKAEVRVDRTFAKFGAIFEADLVKQVCDALKRGAEVISLSFGTNSRNDLSLLGFEVVEERLRSHAGSVLVAAAGNDSARRPFWPAAYPWVVGVGSLNADRQAKASFGATTGHGWTSSRLVRAWSTPSPKDGTCAPSHRTRANGGTSTAWPAGAGRPSRRRWSRGSSRPAYRRPARTADRPRMRCWPRPGPRPYTAGPVILPAGVPGRCSSRDRLTPDAASGVGCPSFSQAGDEVDRRCDDDGHQRERHQGVPQCRPPDLLGLDVGVGDLERHADREGQVGEVAVFRGSASLKSIPPGSPE